jgi:hypothetical protein
VAPIRSLEEVRELVAQAKRDRVEARQAEKAWRNARDRAERSSQKANNAVAIYIASNELSIGLDDGDDEV